MVYVIISDNTFLFFILVNEVVDFLLALVELMLELFNL